MCGGSNNILYRSVRSNLWMFVFIILLPGCATRLPASHYPRVATYAMEETSDTRLGRAYEHTAKRHPGQSGFHILPTGPEALMMRIAMMEASQCSIDMQYFSTRDDTTGKLLLEAATRAADRGVRVRILLDDWNLDDFEAGAVSLNANPHIEIRVFNPYSTRDQSMFSRIGNVFSYAGDFTRRMHNKVLIADNQVAVMGGRNLGDEYFEVSKDINFRDIDVYTSGPITHQISKNFDRYWNSDESFPISALNLPPPDAKTIAKLHDEMEQHWEQMLKSPMGGKLRKMPLPHEVKGGEVPLTWAAAELASDSPGKINQPSETAISAPEIRIDQLVSHAQHEFIIFTPYFVPLDSGVEWLNALVARGVAVRIVTNSLSSTDMVPAQAGYSHYREALVKGGVELYETKSEQPKPPARAMLKPSSQNGLHAKIYMIDRRNLVIGSFNLDPRSAQLNTEQVLVIHSQPLCAKIARLFEEVTAPASSYRVILANTVPVSDQPMIQKGSLAWMTKENGKIVYYDFNPHAGFWRNVTDGLFSLLPIDNQL